LTAFSYAFGIGDGGDRVPSWLIAVVDLTGMPGLYLASLLQSSLGDPASFVVGFGVSGLLWGCLVAAAAAYGLRRRSTHVSAAA
jgi:hypothetical protein